MKQTFLTLLLSLALVFSGASAACAAPYDQGLAFRTLTKRDGLPQTSVMAIERDSEGFMWFATRGGLCRYDGAEFVVYDESNSPIPDNYVTKLLPGSDGRLWIGTTGGLCRMDISTDEMVRFRIPGGIRCLISDSFGFIWACNASSLFRINPANEALTSVSIKQPVVGIAELPDTSSFLAGTTAGVFILSKCDGRMTPLASIPESVNVQALLRDRRSNYWVGTRSDGLFQLDRNLELVAHYTSPQINNDYVRALAEDRDGNIVVGTYDGVNVFRRSEGDVRSYRLGSVPYHDALSFFSVISLCCCPDGTLWVGSYVGGVNFANPFREPFLSFENPGAKLDGIVGNVGAVVPSENGLWIGMEGDGILFRTPGGQYERVPVRGLTSGYRSNIVSSLFRSNGKVMAGYNNGTVATLDEATRKTLSVREISMDCPVMAISRDADGICYFGTWGAGKGGDFHVLDKDGSLHSDFTDPETGNPLFMNVTSILPAGDGSVFVSERDGGVAKYDFRTGDCLRSNLVSPGSKHKTASVNGLVRISDGTILAATHRCGLLRISPSLEVTGAWSVEQGLPSSIVHSVAESDDGILWVATPNAVSSLDVNTGAVRTWSFNSEGESNRRSAALFAGNVFMGVGKDIVRFSPGKALPVTCAVMPRIVRVAADGRDLYCSDSEGSTRFRSLTHLSVYFRSLDYSNDGSVRYAYRIDGLDSQWMLLGGTPHVNIANFTSGRYVFRTKAYSGPDDSVGVEGESFAFRVLVPLWRRWWMLCLYLAIVSLFFWVFISWKKAKTGLDDEREELRRICESMTMNTPETSGASPDAEFMKRVYSCINAHIDDPGLGVDMLCAEAGASRTGLYYKIKKITGMAPMDFVRKVKLDVAARLLTSGALSVSDVAEKVGFSSASYFSTAFKNSFGITPTEYMNDNKSLPQTSTNNKSK